MFNARKKKNNDTISVIIPCFNCSSTIKACLTSVINQTYSNIEIILIDDYSSDSTSKVINNFIQEHKTKKIKYFKNKINKGPGISRNRGLIKSTGSFIAFLDSDDVWHSRKCEIISNIFKSESNCHLIAHRQSILKYKKFFFLYKKKSFKLSYISLFKLIISNIIPTSSVVVRKDCIKKIKFKNKTYAEDFLFWLEFIKLGNKVRFINLPLSFSHRPPYQPGGYSGSLRIHESREIKSINFFCKKYNINKIIKMVWIIWSILKYYRRKLKKV
jgi:glycosyltransferase involved in cell wall biosynthesis